MDGRVSLFCVRKLQPFYLYVDEKKRKILLLTSGLHNLIEKS